VQRDSYYRHIRIPQSSNGAHADSLEAEAACA
jgi:hypothetical protein